MPPNLPSAEAEQIAGSMERISGVTALTDPRAKDNAVRFAIVTVSWALRSALDNWTIRAIPG